MDIVIKEKPTKTAHWPSPRNKKKKVKMNRYAASSSSRLLRSHFSKSFSLRKKVPWWYQILDPKSEFVDRWNRTFLYASFLALFLDPLYFYFPIIGKESCMKIDLVLGVFITFFRTLNDIFFVFHIVLKFRTAYFSSHSFGRGDLITDPYLIAIRYLKTDFCFDFLACLPLPQIVIWFLIPAFKDTTAAHANHTLSLMVLLQYIPRFFQIFPLQRRIIKTSGLIAKTALAGSLYNLGFYVLASHVLGAAYYLLAIQRQSQCWREICAKEANATHSPSCSPQFLDCDSLNDPARDAWYQQTYLTVVCDAKNEGSHFEFGIYADAFTDEVATSRFIERYFYCLWWGLKSLCAYGQNLNTSVFVSESLFASFICIAGLILFALLIGNMQNYWQSTTARLEEWRIKQRDTEEWMRHRQLPPELQERVRRFVQYKWLATRGVDEETILRSLPLDLRRQIQRHICLALVRRVPFFGQMDDQLLDAICERLVSSLNTKDTYLVREGDPVKEMIFIIRGQVESSTTDGGRSGFFNSITLRPGDFCGEELLTWALAPASSSLPSSTRTVKTLTELEAFALRAEDIRFFGIQFKRLHSKRIQHAFRYYSHQWRAWGACFIQAAWRRYVKKKLAMELLEKENLLELIELDDGEEFAPGVGSSAGKAAAATGGSLATTLWASKFAKTPEKGHHQKVTIPDESSLKMPKLFKPSDPDFSADHED
ncbi:LOW QUALITY PROTEIN: probable cyclic nucleotide-gated ion channel 16 [Neltuma alba]|uniref:LOW QUALITY PROTEIN: probable cyclic nucleotide-gated ion channel 16 n=1 Tax=Neltuma alba TaxID=207710 RepID=UPI0010A2B955|nr:LOW QUALITY PROTEIN: probable cyclic nucleotide-gated ion channel 16 [Prosopis alba]